ncbi:hypothetical protein HY464_01125 [Candidatus Peregrinibacteria bacterium]|nr:hypothetical protein [Candidatus Peregrinibacteria bacterium]MBI4129276.1 hypothetical protein [Candidatus Peregrinibacteria bacterium]
MNLLLAERWHPVAAFFGSSFLLNLLWENLQAPLYEGYLSFAQHFPICLRATFGDMVFMAVIYGTLAVVYRDIWWMANPRTYRHPATWTLTILTGTLLAVIFELWAVHVAQRWQYTGAMPLIPVVEVGLVPVLQMLLIPLAILAATSYITHRI